LDDIVLDRLIDRLTSNYNKEIGSNVRKLMELTANPIQENEDALTRIMNWRDIDQAEGKVLDRIGDSVSQERGALTDSIYRVLIKSKIKRSLSNGSIDTLIDFLSFILQVRPEEVRIRELWQDGLGENASIYISVPGGSINSIGLSFGQFGQLINLVVAAGVRASALFEGTFGFSTNYTESEASPQGFANDELTTGGTLGFAFEPEEETEMPF
jgi:hypothetical protein